ncbi:MAG: hypothetical protein H7301_01015 [Cryobacterium sp.]|nr:hypothetical protein [Oligoflexia bacterium]
MKITIQQMQEKEQEIFKKNGVKVDLVSNPTSGIFAEIYSNYGVTWSRFVISPDGSSELNKKAKELASIMPLSLIFDPLLLMLIQARGFYDRDLNSLCISLGSVVAGKPDYITLHESEHFLFEASRRGKTNFMSGAPVNLSFYSKNPLSLPKDGNSSPYSTYLSFEEMVTHATNLESIAQSVKQNRVIPEAGGTENRTFLSHAIGTFMEISENAALASDMGLKMLSSRTISVDSSVKEYRQIKIAKNASFKIELWIPGDLDVTRSGAMINYAKRELTQAKQLAAFNLEYFKNYRTAQTTLSPDNVTLISHFKLAQEQFIKTLRK